MLILRADHTIVSPAVLGCVSNCRCQVRATQAKLLPTLILVAAGIASMMSGDASPIIAGEPPSLIGDDLGAVAEPHADELAGRARFFGTSERFWINLPGRYDRLGSRPLAGSLGGVASGSAPLVRPKSGRVTMVRAG
jgi:hypothetical protein